MRSRPTNAILLLAPKRAGDQALQAALQPLLGGHIDMLICARPICAPPRRRHLIAISGGALAVGRRSGSASEVEEAPGRGSLFAPDGLSFPR